MTQPSGQPRSAGGSSTRNRILDAALARFNAGGIVAVSINSIAAEVGISPGNLYYHFKTKEQIVDWLVKRFQNRIEAITNTTSAIIALDDIWLVVHLALETIQQYRFVYRDIDHLLRESPRIAQRIQKITVQGVAATRRMCHDLATASVIRAAPEDLDSLALQMVFTATCWSTFTGMLPGGDGPADLSGRTAYQVLTLLTPYLSDDARLYMTYLRSKYVKSNKS
jgi:AcrR family transcriptional regulator